MNQKKTKKIKQKKKIGLILGSGSARGMSHIGIIKALEEIEVIPDIIVGCSVGAIVGAAYLNDRLDTLEQWAKSLDKPSILKYFSMNLSMTGFVNMDKMKEFVSVNICTPEQTIEDLKKPFATVATNLVTGEEVWFQQGMLTDAVFSSMALPGIYPAHRYNEELLVDGGLINPVPVNIAKAMGADVTIAVNLNSGLLNSIELSESKSIKKPTNASSDNEDDDSMLTKAKKRIQLMKHNWLSSDNDKDVLPKSFEVVSHSINIMQDRLTKSRLAGDPPDIILSPRLSDIGILELYRANEAIAEGRDAVLRMKDEIVFRVTEH